MSNERVGVEGQGVSRMRWKSKAKVVFSERMMFVLAFLEQRAALGRCATALVVFAYKLVCNTYSYDYNN